ncbi:ImmA/IrrE family metallo-endopeptidase [Micromonospora sonchi]|uniref:ImmA/IrrE family metallo-endopeptidase n=1 Tax=Micromonospora sonchi TaxID=1763543 RepID=UPI00166CC4C1
MTATTRGLRTGRRLLSLVRPSALRLPQPRQERQGLLADGAAHELGHLLPHHDTEPGSQILQRAATAFASEFLAPSTLLADELPPRLDFELECRWGISLKALVCRGLDNSTTAPSTPSPARSKTGDATSRKRHRRAVRDGRQGRLARDGWGVVPRGVE